MMFMTSMIIVPIAILAGMGGIIYAILKVMRKNDTEDYEGKKSF